jgi:hypothetical protein
MTRRLPRVEWCTSRTDRARRSVPRLMHDRLPLRGSRPRRPRVPAGRPGGGPGPKPGGHSRKQPGGLAVPGGLRRRWREAAGAGSQIAPAGPQSWACSSCWSVPMLPSSGTMPGARACEVTVGRVAGRPPGGGRPAKPRLRLALRHHEVITLGRARGFGGSRGASRFVLPLCIIFPSSDSLSHWKVRSRCRVEGGEAMTSVLVRSLCP